MATVNTAGPPTSDVISKLLTTDGLGAKWLSKDVLVDNNTFMISRWGADNVYDDRLHFVIFNAAMLMLNPSQARPFQTGPTPLNFEAEVVDGIWIPICCYKPPRHSIFNSKFSFKFN